MPFFNELFLSKLLIRWWKCFELLSLSLNIGTCLKGKPMGKPNYSFAKRQKEIAKKKKKDEKKQRKLDDKLAAIAAAEAEANPDAVSDDSEETAADDESSEDTPESTE
jgi:hypothetical protein